MSPQPENDLEGLDQPQFRTTINPLLLAWRHKWLLVLGGVVGLLLGSLYYAQKKPTYQSSAQILVVKKRPDVLPIQGMESRSFNEDYIATHITLIKSPLIAGEAAKKGTLSSLQTFVGGGNPTGAIIGGLGISRDPTGSILNLSYLGPVQEDTGAILEAVIESYQDFLNKTYQNVTDETVKLIKEAREVLTKELREKEEKYRDYRLKTPLLWKGKDGANVHTERLGGIEGKRSELIIRRADILGRVTAVENALKEGKNIQDVLSITREPVAKSSTEQGSSLTGDQLASLMIQEETLLEDYGRDHPKVRSLRKQIEQTQRLLKRVGVNSTGESKGPEGRMREEVALYIQGLKRELNHNQISEESMTQLIEREQEAARDVNKFEIEDEFLRNDIKRTQALADGIIKRLQEVEVVKDYGGYDAKTISAPGMGWKTGPNAMPIFAAALVLGIAGGFGLAFLADFTDQNFRSPEEIRRRLGLAIFGHVPFQASKEAKSEASKLDPMLLAHHQPKTRLAEAYRGLRTAVFFSARGAGHQVIQVTSPNMADGKSTLISNLAISIAQSGKKVLLIDADLRRPRLAKLFNINNEKGLVDILTGEASINDMVQKSDAPGLSVLVSGKRPANPAELLSSPKLKELLDTVRNHYDFVLVDTPPLLAVTDPCVVAPAADGILLVLRLTKNCRPSAERAKELLVSLKANVLGVIINKTAETKDRSYYGYGYGYTYGYRPQYDYGYGYGYGGGNGYYTKDQDHYFREDPASGVLKGITIDPSTQEDIGSSQAPDLKVSGETVDLGNEPAQNFWTRWFRKG